MCNQESKSEIARDILSYLTRHPEAQDTVAGIVEWWLLEEHIKRRSQNVKEALAELVASGLIVEIVGKDSQTRYRINRERVRDIRSLLDRDSSGVEQEEKQPPDPSGSQDDDSHS
jgi:hypothetical protein